MVVKCVLLMYFKNSKGPKYRKQVIQFEISSSCSCILVPLCTELGCEIV